MAYVVFSTYEQYHRAVGLIHEVPKVVLILVVVFIYKYRKVYILTIPFRHKLDSIQVAPQILKHLMHISQITVPAPRISSYLSRGTSRIEIKFHPIDVFRSKGSIDNIKIT
ncbi:hypothetical protein IX303_001847 [Porphyromonas levii]|nr:hypothetical protein [Porphyromonas levii]